MTYEKGDLVNVVAYKMRNTRMNEIRLPRELMLVTKDQYWHKITDAGPLVDVITLRDAKRFTFHAISLELVSKAC